ncbi:MAG: nucleotide-binding protein [Thermoanaerobaculia bacterium]
MKQFVLAIAIAATFTSCDKAAEKSAELPANPPAATASQPATTPAGNPTAITGKVLETMNSGGYSYIRLQTAAGEVWTAITEAKIDVGSTITVTPSMTMTDFESPTLNRKFDSIVFATLGDAPAATPAGMAAMAAAMGGDPHGGAMGGKDPGIDLTKLKVAKAEGPDAKTIEELWAQKDTLKGKRVVVRGVVVKYSNDIMGKNWIHLRDGSGSAEKQTDDITVTTNSIAAKGDTVVVTGTLATGVDIGAGYSYAALIEDASVAK